MTDATDPLGTALRLIAAYRPDLGDRLDADSDLDALGLDSLDRIEIAMELECALDVSLDAVAIDTARTPADLARAASAALSRGGIECA